MNRYALFVKADSYDEVDGLLDEDSFVDIHHIGEGEYRIVGDKADIVRVVDALGCGYDEIEEY